MVMSLRDDIWSWVKISMILLYSKYPTSSYLSIRIASTAPVSQTLQFGVQGVVGEMSQDFPRSVDLAPHVIAGS